MATVVTHEIADAYVQYAESFDDGQNPSVIRYKIEKVTGGYTVFSHYWSPGEQRRIHLGAVDISDNWYAEHLKRRQSGFPKFNTGA